MIGFDGFFSSLYIRSLDINVSVNLNGPGLK